MFTSPIPTYDTELALLSQTLATQYTQNLTAQLERLKTQIDGRLLYVLFEEQLCCDPATDHEVPKSVLPIFEPFFGAAAQDIKGDVFAQIARDIGTFAAKVVREQTARADALELEKFQIGAELETLRGVNGLHERSLARLESQLTRLAQVISTTSQFLREQKHQQQSIGDMYQGDNQDKSQKTQQEHEKIPSNTLSRQYQELQQRYIQSMNQLETARSQANMVNSQVQIMSEYKNKNDELDLQLQQERKVNFDLHSQLSEKDTIIEKQSDQYLQLVAEFNELHTKNDDLSAAAQAAVNPDQLRTDLEADLREKFAAQFSALNAQIQALQTEKSASAQNLEDLKGQCAVSDENFLSKQDELERFKAKYLESAESLKTLQISLQTEKKQKENLENQLQEFQVSVVNLNVQSNFANQHQLKELQNQLNEQSDRNSVFSEQIVDKDKEIKRLKAQLAKNMAKITDERSQSWQQLDRSRPGSGMFQQIQGGFDKEVQVSAEFYLLSKVNQSSPNFHRGIYSVYDESSKMQSFDRLSTVTSMSQNTNRASSQANLKIGKNSSKNLVKQSTRPQVDLVNLIGEDSSNIQGILEDDFNEINQNNSRSLSPSVNQLLKAPKGSVQKAKNLNEVIKKVQERYGTNSPQQQRVVLSPERQNSEKEFKNKITQLQNSLDIKCLENDQLQQQNQELKENMKQLEAKIAELEEHIRKFAENYIPIEHVIKDERVASYVNDTSNVDADHKYNVNYYERQLDALKVAQQTVFNLQNNLNSPPHIKKDLQDRVSKIKQNLHSLENQIKSNTDLSVIDDVNGEAPDQTMTEMMQLNKQKNALSLTKNAITNSVIKATTKNSLLDQKKTDKSNQEDLHTIVTTHEKLYSMASLIRTKIEAMKAAHRNSREKIYNRYLESMRLLSKEQMEKLEAERLELKNSNNSQATNQLSIAGLNSSVSNTNYYESGNINLSIVDLQPGGVDNLVFTYRPEKIENTLIYTRNEEIEEKNLPSLRVTRNCSGERKVLTRVCLFDSQTERKSTIRHSGFDYLEPVGATINKLRGKSK
ncbi:hypothetical protein SS50377_26385 [Spironucleus salmonicida]|uniref:Uncharacterized protein n=1 Tax=Spironucleus salmonicida TaxID=348837 RepID=V6LU35_9EUKA|nr:hypothetical protein SS50377_26385 [Spironucleus salmonicida]|eukprot:EST47748.1 hypothetical protein SS50377_12147 [Spironucleus salmonicida]